MYCLAEILVILVVRIVSLDVGSEFFHKLFLNAAVLLYLFVGELYGFEHVVLRNFLHFTLYHHYVLFSCGNHKVDVGLVHLAEVGVDDELAVYTADANL